MPSSKEYDSFCSPRENKKGKDLSRFDIYLF